MFFLGRRSGWGCNFSGQSSQWWTTRTSWKFKWIRVGTCLKLLYISLQCKIPFHHPLYSFCIRVGEHTGVLAFHKSPHFLIGLNLWVSEERHGGAPQHGAIVDVRLVSQVICILNGRGHPLHRQEGRQVCRVGGDQDQCEEPPDAAHNAGGGGPGVEVWPLLHQCAHGEPETVGEGEVILNNMARVHTGVGGGPLVRREPDRVMDDIWGGERGAYLATIQIVRDTKR